MIRRTLMTLTAAAVTLGLSGGVATASGQTVIQAIHAQDKIVHSNPGYRSLQNFSIRTVAQAKAAIPKLIAVEKLLTHAADAVQSASATPAQKAGQKDWVAGVRGVAKATGMLVVALQDVEQGKSSAANTEALAAVKIIRASNTLGIRGDKLLHLPTSD